jgi:hypothetical protein
MRAAMTTKPNPRIPARKPMQASRQLIAVPPLLHPGARRGNRAPSVSRAWRRLDDGAAAPPSEHRFHDAPSDWLPPPPDASHVCEQVPHTLGASAVHSAGGETHHHGVPPLPHRGQQHEVDAKAGIKRPPPSVFPQVLAANISPALAPFAVAGPLLIGTASSFAALVVMGVLIAGHLRGNAQAHVPGEAPLFGERRSWFRRRRGR